MQDIPDSPCTPTRAVRELRAKLLYEEVMETISALGVTVRTDPKTLQTTFVADWETDLVEIIDGCCDVAVVAAGTLLACGVPDEPFLNLVCENNLAKFGPGHSWRPDGKLIKPPGHKPPDIAGELAKLRAGRYRDQVGVVQAVRIQKKREQT